MRARIFSALALFLLALLAVRSLAQEKSDAPAIRALESKWVDAYKQRQIAAVASLLADDYVITQEDGSVYGKVGFISYSAGSLRVGLAEASDLKVHIHDNVAVVTAAYHEKGVQGGKPYDYHDRLTDVWMKNQRQMAAHRLPLQPPRESLIGTRHWPCQINSQYNQTSFQPDTFCLTSAETLSQALCVSSYAVSTLSQFTQKQTLSGASPHDSPVRPDSPIGS